MEESTDRLIVLMYVYDAVLLLTVRLLPPDVGT